MPAEAKPSAATSAPTLQQTKAHMRSVWMSGDFGVIARTVARDAEDSIMAHQRLDGRFQNVRTDRIPLCFDMACSATETVDYLRQYFGPTQTTFQRLDAAAQPALYADLVALWSSTNTASDPHSRMLVPNECLQVTATRADS